MMKNALLFALVLFLAGCSTVPTVPSVAQDPLPAVSPTASVILQPGDHLEIRFPYWPELDVKQTIRPDGRIALLLINEVDAAGLTPEELRQKLLTLYAGQLRNPEITVVANFEKSRWVYVGGEVNTIGSNIEGLVQLPLTGRMTALEALMRAGGPKKTSAKLETVLIVRRVGDQQLARTINLATMFKQPTTQAFFLEPNDILFVPQNEIDRVDQWVSQYMNQPVPDWLKTNLSFYLNPLKHNGSITVSP